MCQCGCCRPPRTRETSVITPTTVGLDIATRKQGIALDPVTACTATPALARWRLSLTVMVKTGSERVGPKHRGGTAVRYFAGIDVSLEESSVCVVDGEGRLVREVKVLSEP